MPTINECRRNAEQCLLWADEPANDEQREKLLEIAGRGVRSARAYAALLLLSAASPASRRRIGSRSPALAGFDDAFGDGLAYRCRLGRMAK